MSKPKRLVRWVVTALAAALLGTITALVYTGVFLWNITAITGPVVDNPYATGSPFTLAQVMAIFGAFGLAAGFSDRVDEKLRRDMRSVAICHFVAAFCFCLLGLLLPAIPYIEEGTASFWLVVLGVLAAIGGAAVSFTWGTAQWLYNIPRILKNEETVKPANCQPPDCN